jgi:hypothetical protein
LRDPGAKHADRYLLQTIEEERPSMRQIATPKTRNMVGELRRLALGVQPCLAFASPAACREWEALQARWPSASDLSKGATALSDGDLEGMLGKVHRFGEILRKRAS